MTNWSDSIRTHWTCLWMSEAESHVKFQVPRYYLGRLYGNTPVRTQFIPVVSRRDIEGRWLWKLNECAKRHHRNINKSFELFSALVLVFRLQQFGDATSHRKSVDFAVRARAKEVTTQILSHLPCSPHAWLPHPLHILSFHLPEEWMNFTVEKTVPFRALIPWLRSCSSRIWKQVYANADLCTPYRGEP